MGRKGIRVPKDNKEQPQWSEKIIQNAIKWQILSPSNIKYYMENLTVFGWESDSLFITRSGYIYECEIKISRGDFKHDFKKKKKHLILECKDNTEQSPNYFYYVVPKDLITVDEIPEYAGLIYVDASYDFEGKINGYPISFVKTAPIIHKEKIDLSTLDLTDKFYFNYLIWKDKANHMKIENAALNAKISQMINSEDKDGDAYIYNINEAKNTIKEQQEKIEALKKKVSDTEENAEYYAECFRLFRRILKQNNIDYQEEFKKFDNNFSKKENIKNGKEIDKK